MRSSAVRGNFTSGRRPLGSSSLKVPIVGASSSMISISPDVRKVQKSCFSATVNVDGKHLKQIKGHCGAFCRLKWTIAHCRNVRGRERVSYID